MLFMSSCMEKTVENVTEKNNALKDEIKLIKAHAATEKSKLLASGKCTHE